MWFRCSLTASRAAAAAETTRREIFHNIADRLVEDENNQLRNEMGDRRNDFARQGADNRHHHGFYQRGNNNHGWWGGTGAYTPKDLEGIPSWDGNPAKWRRYKKDVALWLEGVSLDVPWSWGSRMVRVLTGPAKTLGESIPVEELRAGAWTWNEDAGDWAEPDLLQGITRLLDTLATIGTEAPIRKGQVMTYFYKVLHRRRGEDMNAWVVRFGDAKAQLHEEEVGLPQGTAGWWLIEKSGLTEAQKSMLSTATAGSYDMGTVMQAMIRIFPSLHLSERKLGDLRSGGATTNKRLLLKQKVAKKLKEVN